ncbi:MAG TPA: class I SAM-dependent methyltransferase [Thermoanaerobaculia bacterium]|jgi:SAM-dependent methyltransferase|nr:class I SAM-dependent methyltransferase [Thermoanaerobaculia bacterium]
MPKQYDKAYFDRWYRGRKTRVSTSAEVRRKVLLAVTVAEYFIHRPVRTVLDIGCGEGAWRSHLLALRPRIVYAGLDSSDYAIERFGRERNIRKASFGDLPKMRLGVYDLVVCSDVLHYVPENEIRTGIKAVADVTDGLAFLEVLTKEDDVTGDLDAFIRRPAAWYRKVFASTEMTPVGPYCWLSPAFKDSVAELEKR